MGNRWLEIVTIDSTKLALWKLRRRRARRPLVREDYVSCLEIRMGEFIAKVVQFMGKLLLSSVTRMDFFGKYEIYWGRKNNVETFNKNFLRIIEPHTIPT